MIASREIITGSQRRQKPAPRLGMVRNARLSSSHPPQPERSNVPKSVRTPFALSVAQSHSGGLSGAFGRCCYGRRVPCEGATTPREGVLFFDLSTGKDFRRFDIPTAAFVSSRFRTGDPIGVKWCCGAFCFSHCSRSCPKISDDPPLAFYQALQTLVINLVHSPMGKLDQSLRVIDRFEFSKGTLSSSKRNTTNKCIVIRQAIEALDTTYRT